jgi:hypothetical protein
MVKIYCIEDINDLKYVGSTKQKLNDRLLSHRSGKRRGESVRGCSSKHLNLDNCIIYQLEECVEDLRKERERYWINKLDCVNQKKLNGRDMEKQKEQKKEYYQRIKEHRKEYYNKNKSEINRKRRERYKLLKLSDQKINL